MTNCPFHALAIGNTELVCQMNHALLRGFADSLAPSFSMPISSPVRTDAASH